jgi:transcriptional regulator with XRE-family HTH domain
MRRLNMQGDRLVSENIRALREREDLTQRVVAEVLGLSQPAYSRRESGLQVFSAGEARAIALFAKVDIKKIFGC